MNKWLKRLLVTVVVVLILLLLSLPAFTTSALNGRTVLVAKYSRKEFLKSGDLLLVEANLSVPATQAVYRLEQIYPPDPSSRKKARPGRGRQIAQEILDMDFKPTYSVSLVGRYTNSAPVIVREREIKGKVIYEFGRSRD